MNEKTAVRTLFRSPSSQSSRPEPRAIKRIAVIAPSAATLLPLRGSLLRAIAARRHRILCLAPDFTAAVLDELADLGIECASYPLQQSRLAIGSELKMLRALSAALKQWRPHVVLGYGALPAILAPIAAKHAKAETIVAMFSGLDGIVAPTIDRLDGRRDRQDRQNESQRNRQPKHNKRRRVRNGPGRSLRVQRWRALRSLDALIVHNDEDRRRLESLKLIPSRLPVHVVRGAGVDLDFFTAKPLPAIDGGLCFLMIAQLRQAKGVMDFCQTASRIRAGAPTARFVLVGPSDDSAGGVTVDDLAPHVDDVEFVGAVHDVRPFLEDAHVFVLPSRYGEGMSKTLAEALAAGRPVITSNLAGCREMVDERVNGCLVAPGDVDALSAAVRSFLRRPDLIPAMSRAARAKAERWFDDKDVNRQMLQILNID